MNSSSAILRRFSRSRAAGILKSVVNPDHSRMMSSTGAVSSTKSPWVLAPHKYSEYHMRFYDIAKKEFYSFITNSSESPCYPLPLSPHPTEILSCIVYLRIVGSSHGWIGWSDLNYTRLLFSDPTTDGLIVLPSLEKGMHADRLILEEKGHLAFTTFGPGAEIAFCSPHHSKFWTPFNEREGEGVRVFHDVLHSSRHNRLFCLVGEGEETNLSTKLDCWKVDQCEIQSSSSVPPPPIREWTMDVDVGDENKGKVKYIVCDEDTGDLYLVVRPVELNVNTTLDIHVYRIDWERRKVMLMEDSLNGLSIFVGMNQSFAMVASEVPGLNPDSVYFGSAELTLPGSGVFDYQKKNLSPLINSHALELQREEAVWFTPRHISP